MVKGCRNYSKSSASAKVAINTKECGFGALNLSYLGFLKMRKALCMSLLAIIHSRKLHTLRLSVNSDL